MYELTKPLAHLKKRLFYLAGDDLAFQGPISLNRVGSFFGQ